VAAEGHRLDCVREDEEVLVGVEHLAWAEEYVRRANPKENTNSFGNEGGALSNRLWKCLAVPG
jgi:hypothetical protein